ncbi:hypothetical protein KI387_033069, partial [Taxus chinensis]
MEGLDVGHASELLCWHAFLQPFPLNGFEDLVERFVTFCNGLPLSLKVFGGQLYRKERDYWGSQLNKISRLLHRDIQETLQISYDALDDEEKKIFLDIACFFIGEQKSLAIAVWDGSGWSGLHSWETLANKCLVELDEKNCIRMHDHLRDLGREISTRQSSGRLVWLPKQISDIERGMLIRGIKTETSEFYEELRFTSLSHCQAQTPFQECMELVQSYSRDFKLLVVRDNYFNEEFATLSRSLIWLRWDCFQQKTLPLWLSLKNLRVLELHWAVNLEQLWGDEADPPLELRELIVTRGLRFTSLPTSIGRLKDLKKIICEYCDDLRNLPQEICYLQSLEHLDLRGCASLQCLPTEFGDLRMLRMLPVSFKQLIHLKYINLQYCSHLYFTSANTDILKNMTKLEYLNFDGCSKVEELPLLPFQGALRELRLDWMGSLREIPGSIGELSKLQVLKIGSPNLESLPTSLGNLSSLTMLELYSCSKLKSLPHSIGNLSSLISLAIKELSNLESLPKEVVQLCNLQSLMVESCPIRHLPFLSFSSSLSNLKYISLCKIHKSRISISQQCCPSLESLRLYGNGYLIEITALPISVKALELTYCRKLKSISGICGLINLQKLDVWWCEELEELPSFAELNSLKEFEIIGSRRELKKIEGLEHCKSLETLKAETMWKVTAGIKSLEQMERLRRVELSACYISAIEPGLLTIKKWPSETIICARTERDIDSIVNSPALLSLTVLDSCVKEEIKHHNFTIARLKCGQRHSSNAAAMACFVINSMSRRIALYLESSDGGCRTSTMWMEKGKWVWI